MTTIEIELPDEAVAAARAAGLLTPQALSQLIQDAITRQRNAIGKEFTTDDPAFGIWRDREDIADVNAYVRKLREPRFKPDGSRNDA
jgi:post-segregation antitoxin (ccd killing protein)